MYMEEIKHFTLSVMFTCITISLFLARGIPEFITELIVLVIVCISLILPVLVCLVFIRGEINEHRLRKMIRMIKICMVYQILIVPAVLLATTNMKYGWFAEFMIIREQGIFTIFAVVSSIYLLIASQMQYKNLIESNNKSEQ